MITNAINIWTSAETVKFTLETKGSQITIQESLNTDQPSQIKLTSDESNCLQFFFFF